MESFANVRAALSLPLAPFQYIVNWPSQFIGNIQTAINTHDNLVEENLQLKTDQLLLRSQLQRLIAIESENTYLKSLLQSSRQAKGKTLMAELLAVAAEPYVHQVILDKGSKDGVYIGQPVVDAFGLMGQIMSVGPITSRVLLVNDPHGAVSVQDARTGVRAIASGDSYSGKLRLQYVANTTDIQVGDVFTTSGLGDHYPEGYPVGKVISVSKDPAHQFAEIRLEPSARLDNSRQVLLIWYQRNA